MENTTPTPLPTEQASTPDQPTLTKQEILAAATNSPALTKESFKLGTHEFKVLYLDYDRNIEFMELMEPLLMGVMSVVAAKSGKKIALPGLEAAMPEGGFKLTHIMKFLKKSLPDMVALSCQMTDPAINAEWVKKNAQDPFELARIAFQQINKNQMLTKFLDFFGQTLQGLTTLTESQK